MNNQKKIIGLLSLLLLTITFFSFYSSLGNEFVSWDDNWLLTENTKVFSLSSSNLEEIFCSYHYGLYHPLVLLSYAIEHHFCQLNPFIYHLDNLILHLLNTLLVFFLIINFSKLFQSPKNVDCNHPQLSIIIGFITALFFGIHPSRVESVVWISQRKDVLFTFFYIATLLIYIKSSNWKLIFVSVLFFVFSLMSKPMAITLPAILFLIDWTAGKKLNFKNKLPFIFISIIFLVIALSAGRSSTVSELPFSIKNIFVGSYRTIFYYFGKLVLPLHPYIGPSISKSHSLSLVEVISPFLIIFILLGCWFTKNKKIIFGILFFLIALSPTLKILETGVSGLRYTYIPAIGIFYLIALGLTKLWLLKKYFKFIAIFLFIIISVYFSLTTWNWSRVWKNDLTFATDVTKHSPIDPRGFHMLGQAYSKIGQLDEALKMFNKSIKIRPESSKSYNERGIVFAKKGNLEAAFNDFNHAIKMFPNNAVAYDNRGHVFHVKKFYYKALTDYNKAIVLDPNYVIAYNNRGSLFLDMRKYDQAFSDFEKATELNPYYQLAKNNLINVKKILKR